MYLGGPTSAFEQERRADLENTIWDEVLQLQPLLKLQERRAMISEAAEIISTNRSAVRHSLKKPRC